MTEWLRNHQDNPYPNDDEKEALMQSTKLTINQINYWFTNARRRLLPKWAMMRRNSEETKSRCNSPIMTPYGVTQIDDEPSKLLGLERTPDTVAKMIRDGSKCRGSQESLQLSHNEPITILSDIY